MGTFCKDDGEDVPLSITRAGQAQRLFPDVWLVILSAPARPLRATNSRGGIDHAKAA